MAVFFFAIRRLSRSLVQSLYELGFAVTLFSWDFTLAVLNIFIPRRAEGHVVPKGYPGHGGVWPEYLPPAEGASRCSCPAINALANHGILPRDGRNIRFKELAKTIRKSYNFSPTFCIFATRYIAHILGRSFNDGIFDLSDIDVHNGIEHDASLVREDTYFNPHQGLPSAGLITELLKNATGSAPKPTKLTVEYPKDAPLAPYSALTEKFDLDTTLTPADLSRVLGRRRTASKAQNPQYSQSSTARTFGSSNASTMLTIFGGRTRDLATFLIEERLPTGWEPRFRDVWGLTLTKFNQTVFRVENGIVEELKEPLNLM